MLRTPIAFLFLAISGCTILPNHSASVGTGVDGSACIGNVTSLVSGLNKADNPSLLVKAQFATGKGGVCSAKVFNVTSPLVLYRVFDSGNPYSKFGSWWSLKRPTGSKEDYRAANAICKEWSTLDRLISCEVRPGTQIVVGTTQSAECKDGTSYSKTAENQVFVANDGKAGIIHVGACQDETSWP